MAAYDQKIRQKEKAATAAAARYIELLPELLDKVDEFLLRWPVFGQVAQQIKIRPSYIVPIAMSIGMLFFGWLDSFITTGVGFFYPAWQSFKAIESKQAEDDKQWLTYWVVFAAFTLVEMFSNVLIFWIPFYYPLKIAFLLWLLLPHFQGAKIVYNRAVRPFLIHYQKGIDEFMGRVNTSTYDFSNKISEVVDTASIASNVAAAGGAVRQRLGTNDD